MYYDEQWAEIIFKDKWESPMEYAFVKAWLSTCEECRFGIEEFEKLPRNVIHTPLHYSRIDYLAPQHPIGNYRADFVLARIAMGWVKDLENPGKVITILEKLPLVVVEIDGHDFHEKTKEQASRDKERDRFMTAHGYRVFRFTGSDIYNRADQCVQEIHSAFLLMGSFYDPDDESQTRINNG